VLFCMRLQGGQGTRSYIAVDKNRPGEMLSNEKVRSVTDAKSRTYGQQRCNAQVSRHVFFPSQAVTGQKPPQCPLKQYSVIASRLNLPSETAANDLQ
jgi:hypothetical protein